jgi:phosphatidylinositol kinase/protein kinase (PI-3  family)
MLFDHGQDLAVPETVPFRLTRNLVDAMGVAGETGLFRRACITTLEVLREHRPQLLSVFETFLYDPVDDRRKKDAHLTHEVMFELEKKSRISYKVLNILPLTANRQKNDRGD